jgi:uncharacterized protein YoxC
LLLAPLLAGALALTAQSTQKQNGTVQKQSVAVTRAVNGITSALDDVADRAAKLLSTVQSKKQKTFPTATSPAPDTSDFDNAHVDLLQHVSAVRVAIAAFKERDTYVRTAPSVAVARGAGRGRGRGGRGGAREVMPAAAAASSSDDEAVVAFHANRTREEAAQQAAEREALERRYAAEHAELFADL